MGSDLTKSVVRGGAWIGTSQIFHQVLRFVAMTILARLLFPDDFGVIAMATVITSAGLNLGNMGFNQALIQRKEVTPGHFSTTFWTALAIGIILCVITVAISPLVAIFFNNALVGPILAVLSLTFIIDSLGSVHVAILTKKLEFSKLAIARIGGGIVYLTIAAITALTGFGVWSIVIAELSSVAATVVLLWVVSRWHPSFVYSIQCLKDLWKFGLNLTGARLVASLHMRLDYLIIGRFLTPASAGFYYLAYRTIGMPRERLEAMVTSVTFPAFSIIQDENEQLRRGFLKSVALVSIIVFPLYAGLAIIAPELVKLFFGDKWIMSITPIQVLCIWACVRNLTAPNDPVFMSKGRADIALKTIIIDLIILVPCLLIAVTQGITGVAIAMSSVAGIMWVVRQAITNRLIGLKIRDYIVTMRPAVFGTIVMSTFLFTFRYVATRLLTMPDVALLISCVLLAVSVYFITLKALKTQVLDEIVSLIIDMVRSYARAIIIKIPMHTKKNPRIVD